MDAIERKFASSEVRLNFFGAVAYLLGASFLTDESTGMYLMISLSVYMAWQVVRCWNVPCAQIDSERLVTFDKGRPQHYIQLAQIKEVRKGLNRTLLVMHDGLTVPISHLNFITKADVTAFRATLALRLQG